jgi:hypothetical protein
MDWSKVVTDPLGLGGFALALVFGALSRKSRGMPKWWPAAALGLAALSVAGGLGIAYSRVQTGRPAGLVQEATATGSASAATNIDGNNNVVGSGATSSFAPPNVDTGAPPAATRQKAEAREGGHALNINGSGNSTNESPHN